jgi:uncharacterized protein (DUF885 family)
MPEPFDISNRLVDDLVAISPEFGTEIGALGVDHRWDDFSPAGWDAKADLYRQYRIQLKPHLHHQDRWQRHAARIAVDRLGELIAEHEDGRNFLRLRHTGGFLDSIRDIFDQMDISTDEGWLNVAQRLEKVGEAFGGVEATLNEGRRRGIVVAGRQVESVISQLRYLAGPESKWLGLARSAEEVGTKNAERVGTAVDVGRGEASKFGAYLSETYLADARTEDGVGRDAYVASADGFLGMTVDPIEVYDWGWEEVHRLARAMSDAARQIDPDRSLSEVIERLENDPAFASSSQAAFAEFVQARLDQALDQLDGVHFDVPPEIRKVTVNLVPPGGALGAYYLPPSEDFSRPGGVWYSHGERQQIPLWGEVSTAYHEGFPGHHLQVGTVRTLRQNLSRAHRLWIWYSGYGEGWALYTERLMDELGFLERPEYLLGMLGAQQMRACRVVIDIGLHLGLMIPQQSQVAPGEKWSYEAAIETLHKVAGLPEDVAQSEIKRYLGWPGQAISYKVGEREILSLRDKERNRQGASFDLKDFHRRLLGWGEVRLDYLGEIASSNSQLATGD